MGHLGLHSGPPFYITDRERRLGAMVTDYSVDGFHRESTDLQHHTASDVEDMDRMPTFRGNHVTENRMQVAIHDTVLSASDVCPAVYEKAVRIHQVIIPENHTHVGYVPHRR